MKQNMNKKEKKVVFSEEIDNSISGFAIVLTFIVIGIFLIFNSQYFGKEIVAKVTQWTFIVVGTLGFSTEISKLKKNKEKIIKGIDDIIIGIVLIVIWFLIYHIWNNWVVNSIGFLILIIGAYGTFRGVLEVTYSTVKLKKENGDKRKGTSREIIKDILLMLSQIVGICLIAVQLLQALGVI